MYNMSVYSIVKTDCPSGYAYVKDFKGNMCYYGPVAECKKFIEYIWGEYMKQQRAIRETWDMMIKEDVINV